MSENLTYRSISSGCDRRCDQRNIYCSHHSTRGKALIFNQSVFEYLPSRHGSKPDRENIVKCFKYLGFDVDVHIDSTADAIFHILKEEASRDHSEEDYFVCVFMSHGSEGLIHCHDRPIEVSAIMEFFNHQKCPSLSGKPKLFFINACRGDQIDPGLDVVDAFNISQNYDTTPISIPGEDFLVACSVVSGYASARDFRSGSCFVAALSQVVQEHGKSLDLVKILTRVNSKIALEFERKGGTKQMSCLYSMLTKNVVF